MASKIEWTDETWNPVTGCSKISPGCKNCYAERMAKRLRGRFGYPKDGPFKVTFHSGHTLHKPLHWKKPRRVFVVSMGDLFHKDVPFYTIDIILNTAFRAPQHTYILLTKRPARMGQYFESCRERGIPVLHWERHGLKLWLGVSCENQKFYDERWEIAKAIPCSKLFISLEPLLGPIELRPWGRKPDWVIAGCESGPGRRPAKIEWFRDLKDQCVAAGVPFFFKQSSTDWGRGRLPTITKMPWLDSQVWDQLPEARNKP